MGRRGHVPLRRLGDLSLRRRWVFHLRLAWESRGHVLMERRCCILLRPRHDVPIRCCGDVPLRPLSDVPPTRRLVFHLRRTCDVPGTSKGRRYGVTTTSCCRLVSQLQHLFRSAKKPSKVNIRKKEVCSKSVIKTHYGSKFFGKWIHFHCEGSRWSEISCARDIAEKSLSRLLLLITLKSSYPRCTVEKGALKYFTKFTRKRLCWSLF